MKYALRTESLMEKLMSPDMDDHAFLGHYINMYLGLIPFKLNDEYPYLWDALKVFQSIFDENSPIDSCNDINDSVLHCYQKHPDTGFILAETLGIKTETLFKALMTTKNEHTKPFHEWVKRGGYERSKEKIKNNDFLRIPAFDFELFVLLLKEAEKKNESLFECLVNKSREDNQ